MANGWAKDGAVQDQIDASIQDAIKRSRSNLPSGESLHHCEECGESIPEGRRQAMPGVRLCVKCQDSIDDQHVDNRGYNRSGSKDSQLR